MYDCSAQRHQPSFRIDGTKARFNLSTWALRVTTIPCKWKTVPDIMMPLFGRMGGSTPLPLPVFCALPAPSTRPPQKRAPRTPVESPSNEPLRRANQLQSALHRWNSCSAKTWQTVPGAQLGHSGEEPQDPAPEISFKVTKTEKERKDQTRSTDRSNE